MTTFNITDVYTSRPVGVTEQKYTPMVGETYRLTVEFDVVGTPQAHYPLEVVMADRWLDAQISDLATGHKRVSFDFFLPLDGEIPWEVQVDPYGYANGVDPIKSPIPHKFPDVLGGGQTIRVGRPTRSTTQATRKGSFEPAPPTSSIDYYDPVAALGYQMLKVTFPVGGEVQRIVAMMGSPLSEGWQKVTSATCSVQSGAGSSALLPIQVNNPSRYPVYFWDHSNLPASDVTMVGSWLLQLHNVRVDQAKLRNVTWQQLDDIRQTQPFTFYASHEVVIQSDDPEITNFAKQTLGQGHRLAMTPYDAARKLFQAVLAHTTYYYPQPGQPDLRPATAKAMLEKGFGDCGGFSILLVALFRSIGFAARTACGCWTGLDNGHCWCELYFPGHGWVICDGSAGNNASESGDFAYYFGNIPDLNLRFATMRGNTFNVADVETLWLQGPYERVWGNSHEKSTTAHTMLIEHFNLGPVGQPSKSPPHPQLENAIQLAHHRCHCAAHGGFRPDLRTRVATSPAAPE